MEKNLEKNNRIIRIIVGLILLFVGLMGGMFDIILILITLIGLILIATGAIGFCPIVQYMNKNKTS